MYYEFQPVAVNLNLLHSLLVVFTAQSEGRPCEYNSRIYQNGESFQPNWSTDRDVLSTKHCLNGGEGAEPGLMRGGYLRSYWSALKDTLGMWGEFHGSALLPRAA